MAIGGKRVLAIIPARGGSKRFPGKNLALFHGKPLVVHAVEQALASKYVDSVVVSSDSEAILGAVQLLGSPNVFPVERPAELSTDDAPTEFAVQHALISHARSGFPAELFVVLQPTSPARSISDIDACIELAYTNEASYSCQDDSEEPNGAAYAMLTHAFLQGNALGVEWATTYGMPPERSHDINTPEDLERAQRA